MASAGGDAKLAEQTKTREGERGRERAREGERGREKAREGERAGRRETMGGGVSCSGQLGPRGTHHRTEDLPPLLLIREQCLVRLATEGEERRQAQLTDQLRATRAGSES